MHRLVLSAVLCCPFAANAQSWGAAPEAMPPSLLAPAATPNAATAAPPPLPGLYNQTGDLHNEPNTSRYDAAGAPPASPTEAMPAPEAASQRAEDSDRH